MPNRYLRVLTVFATALLAVRATALDAEGKMLLQAVRQARAAAFDSVPAGRGVAEFDIRNEYSDGRAEERPLTKVSFAFAGHDSWVRESLPEQPNKIAFAMLGHGPRIVRFNTGNAELSGPQGVVIFQRTSAPLDEPYRWSFQEAAQLPVPLEEGEFFASTMDFPGASIKRTGTIVVLSISENSSASNVASQGRVYEFDMSLGGMLVAYAYHKEAKEVTSVKGAAEVVEMVERNTSHKLKWKVSGGCQLPAERLIISSMRGRTLTQTRTTRIKYLEFRIEDVTTDDLSIKALNIAQGTQVFDQIHNVAYKFYDELGKYMLGESGGQPPKAVSPVPVADAELRTSGLGVSAGRISTPFHVIAWWSAASTLLCVVVFVVHLAIRGRARK